MFESESLKSGSELESSADESDSEETRMEELAEPADDDEDNNFGFQRNESEYHNDAPKSFPPRRRACIRKKV